MPPEWSGSQDSPPPEEAGRHGGLATTGLGARPVRANLPHALRRAYRAASHAGILNSVATEQIAVRLPGQLLEELDALVKRGVYESRAAAVRAGIEAIMQLERRQQTDRAIVEGYTRHPPTEPEASAALASLREAILDEPW